MTGRWLRRGAVALLVALGAACSDDDPAAERTTTTTTEAPTPTLSGDGSAFCDAMLGVGQVAGANGASVDEVLAATEVLVSHLDEAQANTPPDAPADFDALIDDYRLATDAIFEAEGDVAAAFEALGREHPDVVDRLGSSTSHAEAYDFLVERCGIGPEEG